MSKRFPQYEPGAEWRVERDMNPFTFIILGPGSKPGHKRCLVKFDEERWNRKNFESDFTHDHLKKHAVYQEKK